MEDKTKTQFTDITTRAIQTIDGLRSNGANPAVEDNGSPDKVESRISTLYRIIGLPAFTDDASKFDRYNNGNLFRPSDIAKTDMDKILKEIKTRDDAFRVKLKEDDIKNFLDINIDKVSLGTNSGERKKGGIFPMAVDGRLSIQPTSRRISEQFHIKAQVFSKVEYTRPFIELVVLLRTKGEGNVDSTTTQSLNSDIEKIVGEDFDVDIKNLNFEVAEVVRSLIKVVLSGEGVVEYINKTIADLGKIRDQISDIYPDTSKDTIVTEQQQSIEKTPEEQSGEIEKQKRERDEAQAVERLRLRLLEYDDTQAQEVTKNMKDVVLASTVLSLISTESTEVLEKEREDEPKKERIKQLLRVGNQHMDLILGTYTGLSGIDIMVIITAMFIIPIGDLVALLNDDNRKRLDNIRPNVSSSGSVLAAIEVLEEKVQEIYNSLDKKIEINSVLKSSEEDRV